MVKHLNKVKTYGGDMYKCFGKQTPEKCQHQSKEQLIKATVSDLSKV